MDRTEICYLSAVEMAGMIKLKKLSPVDIIEAVLSRIEQLNPRVNAYCTIVAEEARKQAKQAETMVMKKEKLGPLHGIPVSIKDLIFTKGIRTTGGSKIYEHFIPDQDAVVVERLKRAGAIIIGKTNTPEFGYLSLKTDNRIFGETHNPWNLEYSTGGSSGGAAAAVASGMGPIGIGSDSGGSIREPASFCGIFGLKPSFGRVPQYPEFLRIDSLCLWHTGPLTRTVSDAALVMETIAGRDDRDWNSLPETHLPYLSLLDGNLKGLRIAWCKDLGYGIVDPRIIEALETSVKIFDKLGASLEEANPQAGCPDDFLNTLYSAYRQVNFEDKIEKWRDQMDPGLVQRFDQEKRTLSEYIKAEFERTAYRDKMRLFFEKFDILLTPTMPMVPYKLNSTEIGEIGGIKVDTPTDWINYFLPPFDATGQPAASVPCGWTDEGLPIGMQIVGRRFDDATVLKVADAFEKASSWTYRRPPLD